MSLSAHSQKEYHLSFSHTLNRSSSRVPLSFDQAVGSFERSWLIARERKRVRLTVNSKYQRPSSGCSCPPPLRGGYPGFGSLLSHTLLASYNAGFVDGLIVFKPKSLLSDLKSSCGFAAGEKQSCCECNKLNHGTLDKLPLRGVRTCFQASSHLGSWVLLSTLLIISTLRVYDLRVSRRSHSNLINLSLLFEASRQFLLRADAYSVWMLGGSNWKERSTVSETYSEFL